MQDLPKKQCINLACVWGGVFICRDPALCLYSLIFFVFGSVQSVSSGTPLVCDTFNQTFITQLCSKVYSDWTITAFYCLLFLNNRLLLWTEFWSLKGHG